MGYAAAMLPRLNGTPVIELALTTTAATLVLLGALERLAIVHQTKLAGRVARLDTTGAQPVAWIDPDADTEDLNRALGEMLLVIASGPEAAPTAIPVRQLYAVS